METRYRPCKPCCDNPCIVDKDLFDRADVADLFEDDDAERWDDSLGSGNRWELKSNELFLNAIGLEDNNLRYMKDVPRQFRYTLNLRIASDISADESRTIIFSYRARKGAEENKYDIVITLGRASECGIIKIMDMSAGSTEMESSEMPKDILCGDNYYKLDVCYSAEKAILTVCFDDVALHATEVVSPTNTLDEGEILFEVDSAAVNHYHIKDFHMYQTKTEETGDYGVADDCPGCKPCGNGMCDGEEDDFEDDVIGECEWANKSGTWTENSGNVSSGDEDARLQWKRKWSGVKADGNYDPSTLLEGEVFTDVGAWENEAVLWMEFTIEEDQHEYIAVLKWAEEADDEEIGTLSIRDSTGILETMDVPGIVAGLDAEDNLPLYEFRMCYDGKKLSAAVRKKGTKNTYTVDYNTPFDNTSEKFKYEVGIGAGATTGAIHFEKFFISHNLEDVRCLSCFEWEKECTSLCPDGTPSYFMISTNDSLDDNVDGCETGDDAKCKFKKSWTMVRSPEFDEPGYCVWTLYPLYRAEGTVSPCVGAVNVHNPCGGIGGDIGAYDSVEQYCKDTSWMPAGDPPYDEKFPLRKASFEVVLCETAGYVLGDWYWLRRAFHPVQVFLDGGRLRISCVVTNHFLSPTGVGFNISGYGLSFGYEIRETSQDLDCLTMKGVAVHYPEYDGPPGSGCSGIHPDAATLCDWPNLKLNFQAS